MSSISPCFSASLGINAGFWNSVIIRLLIVTATVYMGIRLMKKPICRNRRVHEKSGMPKAPLMTVDTAVPPTYKAACAADQSDRRAPGTRPARAITFAACATTYFAHVYAAALCHIRRCPRQPARMPAKPARLRLCPCGNTRANRSPYRVVFIAHRYLCTSDTLSNSGLKFSLASVCSDDMALEM